MIKTIDTFSVRRDPAEVMELILVGIALVGVELVEVVFPPILPVVVAFGAVELDDEALRSSVGRYVSVPFMRRHR